MTRVGRVGIGAAVVGAITVTVGVIIEPRQALTSYLFAYAAALTIVLGALMQLMIGQLTGARWFDPFRALALDIVGAMPALVLLALPILIGVRIIYPWATPWLLPPDAQAIVARKHAWLNVPFFVARAVVYLAVWTVFAERFRRAALRGERANECGNVERAHRLRKLSAGGLVGVGLALTFASFDWLMSLEPTWYSTIYGVYLFAGGILAALALVAVLTFWRTAGSNTPLPAITSEQRGAVGKLLFTFVMFWAYIGFAQYLIIWIGDMPADASWYVVRTRGGWGVVAAVIAIGQFAVPFLLLLPHDLKRNARVLAGVGAWLVAMHVLDLYWLVLPALHPEGALPSWLDACALLLVAGFVTAAVDWRADAARQ